MEETKKKGECMKRNERIECSRINRVEPKQVMIVNVLKGKGTQESLYREVEVYYDLDGNYLFELDPLTSLIND